MSFLPSWDEREAVAMLAGALTTMAAMSALEPSHATGLRAEVLAKVGGPERDLIRQLAAELGPED